MKQLLTVIILPLMLGYNVSSLASEKMLRDFFSNVDTLQASFSQRVTDESGMTLESSTGVFYLSRPGKFRWDYDSFDPDVPEGQQIISDGSLITFYEPDLATASQRSFTDAVEQVPTMVLVQSGGDLEKHFTIRDFGLTDGLSWVALRPKDDEAGYRELMIGFDGSELNTIVLTDGLGNETRLVLSNVKSNSALPGKTFEFTLPEGVDLAS